LEQRAGTGLGALVGPGTDIAHGFTIECESDERDDGREMQRRKKAS
jgi:hypothetical protein